jgi:hypothetical protein
MLGGSMTTLHVLQEKWAEKFDRMRRLFPGEVTRPHLTVAPDGYAPERIPSVLYVGKAVGPNEPELENLNAMQLRQKTSEFLKRFASNQYRGSAFCDFGLRLSAALNRHAGHLEIAPLQNLVWTNICKIGVCKGNPPDLVYECQRDLAIQTLRAEIAFYQPRLVFWATNTYRYDAVRETVGDESENDNSWTKDLGERGIYTRGPFNSMPAMVWTPHPQGKPEPDWGLWIEQACKLISA